MIGILFISSLSGRSRVGVMGAEQRLRSKKADVEGLREKLHDATTNGEGYQRKRKES